MLEGGYKANQAKDNLKGSHSDKNACPCNKRILTERAVLLHALYREYPIAEHGEPQGL